MYDSEDILRSEAQVLAVEILEPKHVPKVAGLIQPHQFLGEEHRELQRFIVRLHDVTGGKFPDKILEALEMVAQRDGNTYWDYMTIGEFASVLPTHDFEHHLRVVVNDYRRRESLELLKGGVEYLQVYRKDGGQKLAERMVPRIFKLYDTAIGDTDHMLRVTRDDMESVGEDLLVEDTGIDIPFPKLQATLGPLMPGEVWGLSGYSGNGKTQFALNLARRVALEGTPVIIASTEMGKRWHLRTAAIESGVEQRKVEKKTDLSEADIKALRQSLREMQGWPMVVDTTASLSPQGLMTMVKQTRMAWPNKHVLVIVDHMHRLDYGRHDANREVGNATKALKNMAASDIHGGMSVLALFQPRKPDENADLYAPVRGHQVRGDYAVFAEVDIHTSVFRMWVEADNMGRTKISADGAPILAKKKTAGTRVKLCDDRTFFLTDKRRVGGEDAKPDVLRYDNSTGEIY